MLQFLAELQPGVALLLQLRMARGAVADGLEALHQRTGVAGELLPPGVLQQQGLGQERLGLHLLERPDLGERGDEELAGRGLLEAGLAGVVLRLRFDLDLGHGGLGRGLDDDGLGDGLDHGGLDRLLDRLQRRELLAVQAGQDLARAELLQCGHVRAALDQVRDLGDGVDADQLAVVEHVFGGDARFDQLGRRVDRRLATVRRHVLALRLDELALRQAVVEVGVEHVDDGLVELAHGDSRCARHCSTRVHHMDTCL